MISLDFNELKKSITSSEWTKVGAKFNDPCFSIFPEDMNEGLKDVQFVINKPVFFDDDTHKYKIIPSKKDNKNYFEVYMKIISKEGAKKIEPKKSNILAKFNIPLIISIIIVFAALVICLDPIVKALFG